MMRVLSALVLIPVALICIWLGSPWFAAMLAIVILAAGAEWRTIAVIERTGLRMLSIMVPLFVLVVSEVAVPSAGLFVLVVGLALTIGTFAAPINERIWSLVAHIHLSLAVVALLYLREQPETGLDLVVFLFAIVWMSDIGGYVAGRLVGGPRLAPGISPNKTWAGAAGAVLFSLAMAAVMTHLADVPSEPVLGIAFVLSLATQCGDLFESWIKRHFDVKDSGTLIPGHGGVLDRVDGVLFAAPALALIALLFGTDFIVWR
ncbi:MAG: phosphatidate cytidylyltransferase [Alphaproteobacteria bacterium]|jgi:phosphatidate cytidylyltransferase